MLPRGERGPEVAAKLARLRARMAARGIAAAVLTRSANTAWLAAGAATYINIATDGGEASIVVTADRATVVTNRVEAPRLQLEERLEEIGFSLTIGAWYAPDATLRAALDGLTPTTDQDGTALAEELLPLRTRLMPAEVARLREGGRLAAAAMDESIRATRPGMSEYDVAALLAAATNRRGGQAVVNLVASDERIPRFRHPLPTAKIVERAALLVLCFRHEGLVLSLTRLVQFGQVPAEIHANMLAAAQVDARMILGTRAGRTLGEMYDLARDAYREVGHPGTIEFLHQGGLAGYQGREALATPGNPLVIETDQAFAWNPTLPGVKSEDTIILTATGPEVVTAIPGWPALDVTIPDGWRLARPAILEA